MEKHTNRMLILVLMCSSMMLVHTAFPSLSADLIGDSRVKMDDYAALSSSWMTAFPWWPDGRQAQKIAHWTFDLNAEDSQLTFDGAVIGNPVWFIKKTDPENVKIGTGAIGLNGQDAIEIDNSEFPTFYGSFTLDVWIKTDYSQQSQTIISKGDSSWQVGIEGSSGKAFLSCPGLSGATYLTGSTILTTGLWHHLAAVYDADSEQIYLYLDGGIDGQASAVGQVDEDNQKIWIGSNPQTQNAWWHGILDDVRVYNYALTLEQIFDDQTYHVDVSTGTDTPDPPNMEWGKGRQQAFKTIQHAIDLASDGDTILVWPGRYQESLFFMGKAVTVRSAADAAILEPDPDDPDGITVTFMYGEQSDSILEHFVIANSSTAVWIHQSSPTLRHLTVVNNNYGIESIFNAHPLIQHSIFWNNSASDIDYDTYAPEVNYSCLQQPYQGTGNISMDPLFVNSDSSDPNMMDFHLKSQYGRYFSNGISESRPSLENWNLDNGTSPCIDAGPPEINPFCETMTNGGRINIGAYGNTLFASKSPWGLPADLNRDGNIYIEDLFLLSEQWLQTQTP